MTPSGYVKVKYVFANGEFKSEIIERGIGTSCNTEDDKMILTETDSMIGKTESSGLTSEGKRNRRESPMAHIPQTETPFGGKGIFLPGSLPPEDKKKLDLGFG